MKNILGNILEYCAKAGSSFVRLIKRAVSRIRTVFIKTPKKNRQSSNYADRNSVSVTSVRYNRKPKKWWQDKRLLIAGGGVVVVIALVLIFAFPSDPNEALASIGGGMTKDDTQSAAPIDGQETSSQSVPAEALNEGESPSVSDNSMTVQGMHEPSVSQNAETTPIPTTAPDKTELMPGVHDPQMIGIQERLMDLDYLDDDEPTDYYGNGTKYALQLFQRKNNLQVDGLLGENTIANLYADDALPYTVKLGDRGSDVKAMQERLQELKYLKAGKTGYFGTDTEKAVKSFQKRNGLSADGNVGEYTREVLFSEDAKAAKTSTGGGSSGGSSGGNTGGGTTIAVGDPNQASVDKLIEIAKSKLGCEYTRAGKGPNEFDCSGFVYYCLNTAGYSFKYMTSSGWSKCGLPKVTSMADMKKGDIICFRGHVGIYMGDGQMIDAGSSSDSVRICNVNSKYWVRNFICARRVF